MNKTAVQWLEDTLNKRLIHLSDEKTHIKHFVRTSKCAEVRKILETINQAKKMEKEQIEKVFVDVTKATLQNLGIKSTI
jgi:hypothetical protein